MQKQIVTKPQVDKCKYTVVPIQNQEHRDKLDKFVRSRGKIKLKGSLCRFYLRGICIMKSQYCKFAHGVKQLDLECETDLFYLSDKERRKRQFTQKKQFNQTALFILKNVKYITLHEYQFSQRYKKSNMPIHDMDTISNDRSIRIRIRQIMHRENWDGFIDFLQKRFPETNYPISFISFWYANFGFDKPQTRCKFGDFLKYAMHVRKYIQVDIIFPPNTQHSIFLINSQSKVTLLQKNAEKIYDLCMKEKEQYSKQKMQEFLEKALPQQLSKKYICRYFMAGNCPLSAQQCLYAHSIEELSERYEIGQQFPPQYRQPVMPIQVRMNFTSLYQATRKYQQFETQTLQDINLNSTIRNQLREKIHYQLFGDFLKFLQSELGPKDKNKFFQIQLKDLQKYYNGAGFNHTNENKFQHLQSSLWDLGYHMEDVAFKDEVTLEKKKVTFVYKIPPVEYLNQAYRKIIKQCVQNQIKTLSQNGVLLESALRRTIYSYPKQSILPLHVYLRFRNVTFQDVISQFCSKEQMDRIFFQSGQENIKKITQIVKKFMKKNKNYIMKVDEIQRFIKQNKKDEVNLNHQYMNLRTIIQASVLDSGKKIYFWPFDNNAFIIDTSHFANYKKNKIQSLKNMQKDERLQQFKQKCEKDQIIQFLNKRIAIVDNLEALNYAKKYLISCSVMGVDLEGKLRADGFVDLVQISGVKRKDKNTIQHKQIFIFDIWLMRKKLQNYKNEIQKQIITSSEQSQINNILTSNKQQSYEILYQDTINLLKNIFENQNKVKILHDCRQDSIALKHLLGINLQNVFDTSGFDVYMNVKKIYEKQDNGNSLNLLRKVYDVKVPGLNTIFDSYKAPNGINIFKQSMKKKFGEKDSRPYFEQRPIDEQFLEYSARDVEDLIQVYQNMIQEDYELLASFIGNLYSAC